MPRAQIIRIQASLAKDKIDETKNVKLHYVDIFVPLVKKIFRNIILIGICA